jgi:hypothetical protein
MTLLPPMLRFAIRSPAPLFRLMIGPAESRLRRDDAVSIARFIIRGGISLYRVGAYRYSKWGDSL